MLAAILVGAAARAWGLARGQPRAWRRRFVTAVGFTPIALFDGFAIVTAQDAGVPGWAIAVLAAAVVAGRRAVHWVERKAASATYPRVPVQERAGQEAPRVVRIKREFRQNGHRCSARERASACLSRRGGS